MWGETRATSFSHMTSLTPFFSLPSSQRQSSNPCLSSKSPCLNNGTCLFSTQTSELTCMCTEGFSGSRCEVDLCARLNCPQNAVCIKGERCECLPGFFGKNFARYGNLFVAAAAHTVVFWPTLSINYFHLKVIELYIPFWIWHWSSSNPER